VSKRLSLASRAISAEKARRCCRWNALRVQQTTLRLVGEMLSEATDARASGQTNQEIFLGTVSGKSLLERGTVTPRVQTDFERLLQRSSPTEFERLVRQETPASELRVRRGPAGTAAGLGAVVLVAAEGLSSIAAQVATLETLTGVLELLTRTTLTDDCDGCIRRAMWKQNRKQVKETGTIRRRV